MPNKLTINEILDRFKIAHNNKYEYDLVEYKSNKDKVTIICPYHGRFESIIKNHLDGHGCKKCINFSKKDYSVDIGKYRIVHGDKYDYSLVKYTNEKRKIEIICPIHGVFWQSPNSHINGRGCSKCSNNKKMTTEEYLKLYSDERYDYTNTIYNGMSKKIDIICKMHGQFTQIAMHHAYVKTGCPKCNISKGEERIEHMLNSYNIRYEQQKIFDGCLYKDKLKFDFYLPDYDICIEYNGIQHYEPVEVFGGEKEFNIQKERDKYKEKWCKENNKKLLIIKFDQFNDIENIINQKLSLYL